MFRHDRDARFALEGKHAEVTCDACHETRKTASGTAAWYRHGRLACADCHDDHHARRPFQGGAR